MVSCLVVAIFFNVFAAIRLWDHRNHVVSETRVTTDYDAPYRMYLDEPFETRVASGELRSDQRSEAIPTEEQGNGQVRLPPTTDHRPRLAGSPTALWLAPGPGPLP